MARLRAIRLLKAVALYLAGVAVLFVALLVGEHAPNITFNSPIIQALPLTLLIVAALILFGFSVAIVFDSPNPYFFKTAIMSFVGGFSLFAFGLASVGTHTSTIVTFDSLVLGVLFILAGVMRLFIQGGLAAYRKMKRGE